MKAFVVLILAFACGCGSTESRLRQANTVEHGTQENRAETQAQSQVLGVQVAKVAEDISALKADVQASFQKLVEVNAKQINGVKADLDAKVSASLNTNASLLSEIETLKTELRAEVAARAAGAIAYKADIEQLEQRINAGRDVIQYTKEMADEKVNQTKLYSQQAIDQQRQTMWAIVSVVSIMAGAMVKMAVSSRNRAYRKHGEGHLLNDAPWWQFWRA